MSLPENTTSLTDANGNLIGPLNPLPSAARPPFAASSNVIRPNTTPSIAVGQLIANSATALSVVPFAFDTGVSAGIVRTAWLRDTNANLLGKTIRLHLYAGAPVPVNGDAGTWLTPSAGYRGGLDVMFDRTFSDGVYGRIDGTELTYALSSGTMLYGLAEARSTWVEIGLSTLTAGIHGYPN